MKMYEKKFVMIIGILLILGGWAGSALSAELMIGLVDMQRAINESQAGKDARKLDNNEVGKYQRQFTEKQQELQTMRENLEKQAFMLSSDARTAKERELQIKIKDFQRWQEDTQNEINQKRMDLTQNVQLGLRRVIKKLAEDEGYIIILEKNENMVLFAIKAIDLTDRVIKLSDAQKDTQKK
jgi:outer membrane protein